MAERVVKVRLAAQVSDYEKGMLAAARATATVGTEAEKLAQKRQAFEQVGRGLVVTGAALTAVTALSIKAAAGWQSAWAGVTKTVDGTDEELARVEQGLRGLTKVLPSAHDEIAAVAEAAGQLGIKTPNVVAFTRTMIDLGETTNLSANDAATALARFTNIMGTSQGQVSNLGSALVGLGNNYATTESEILEMSLRLAGAGNQIGLTEGEVLGLSTALSSVGIDAEAGGSAMSKVMIDIAASVETGGDKLDKFASAAGMSAEAFAKQWKSDPAAALASFVTGLSDTEAQGQSTLSVLADLGITEVRMRDALLRSSAAAGQFAGAMADGNTAFDENNALTLEAAKRYETVESKMAIAGNAVRDAAIDFGDVFLPAVAAASEGVTEFAGFMGGLPDPVQGVLGVLTGAVGMIALVGGTALLAVPKIAEFKIALQTLGISMRSLALVGGGAILALTALVTVVGAVASAQAAARQKAESYADTLAEGTQKVTDATRELIATNLTADQSFLWISQGSLADNAKTLGLSINTVREAVEGNADALEKVNEAIKSGIAEGSKPMKDANLEAYDAAVLLQSGIEGEIGAIDEATKLARDKEEATKSSTAASETAADVAGSAADAYLEEADAAGSLASQLSQLVDKINEANGVGQDAVSTNARYQSALAGISEEIQNQKDAYEEANGSLDGFNASLDENTESGSANAAMLSDVAGAAQTAAAAQFEQDKATMDADDAAQKYYGTLQSQRQAFIDSATAAGFNADEVQILADKVFALPDEKAMAVIAETAAAQAEIDRLVRNATGRSVTIKVFADGSGFNAGNFTVTPNSANGNLFTHQFADGGVASNLPTGIYPGGRPIFKFAEEETKWEAFISGKSGQESRNRNITKDAASRLGGVAFFPGEVTAFANGGVTDQRRREATDWFKDLRRGEPQSKGVNGSGLSLVDELFSVASNIGGKYGVALVEQAKKAESAFLSLESAADKADDAVKSAEKKADAYLDAAEDRSEKRSKDAAAKSEKWLDWAEDRQDERNKKAKARGDAAIDSAEKKQDERNKKADAQASAVIDKATKSAATSVEKVTKKWADRLDEITGKVDELRNASSQMASSISGAVRGFYDLGGMAEGTTKTVTDNKTRTVGGVTFQTSSEREVEVPVTAGSIKKGFSQAASGIKAFAEKLKKLAKKGIAPALLAEIAGLGVDGGTPIVDALLVASAADIKSINSSYKQVGNFSNAAGQTAADANYKQVIEASEKQLRAAEKASKAEIAADDKRAKQQIAAAEKRAKTIRDSAAKIGRDQVATAKSLAKALRDNAAKVGREEVAKAEARGKQERQLAKDLNEKDIANAKKVGAAAVADAKKNRDAINAALKKETDRLIQSISAAMKTPWAGEKKALGVPIVGPGTGTSDEVQALLSNGEHVLTAAEVIAAGGHSKVEEWRRSLLAGKRATAKSSVMAPMSAMRREDIRASRSQAGSSASRQGATFTFTGPINGANEAEIAREFDKRVRRSLTLAGVTNGVGD